MSFTTSAQATPRQLAEAFCNMMSDQQGEFFAHVKKFADEHWSGWNALEMQAFYIHDDVTGKYDEKPEYGDDAKDAIMTLAAPFYLNTPRAAGQY